MNTGQSRLAGEWIAIAMGELISMNMSLLCSLRDAAVAKVYYYKSVIAYTRFSNSTWRLEAVAKHL
jgi:hypothetical protein